MRMVFGNMDILEYGELNSLIAICVCNTLELFKLWQCGLQAVNADSHMLFKALVKSRDELCRMGIDCRCHLQGCGLPLTLVIMMRGKGEEKGAWSVSAAKCDRSLNPRLTS